MDLKTASSQEIASYFSREVNNFCFSPKVTAEDLKSSRLMKDLDLCWLRILSDPTYRTDLRNEKSSIVGRQLADIPFVKRKIELVDNPKMEDVAKRMAMDHRTLQQTFSGLVFYHFMLTCNKRENQTLLKVMGNSFYKLPLI
ncbi:hypothetical protein D7V90_22610 [bacterium 1xD42-87]|nr:hypothetical protein D7V90_22610 [bacterium 1xD42-87]